MRMTPAQRKFALAVHVTLSVGWIGAVVAFLALVFAAMSTQDAATLRAAWIGMDLMGWWAIVPLAFASLVTGIVVSLGTKWGLFRHYWTLLSLVLTVVATAVLVGNMQAVSFHASLATGMDDADLATLRGGLGTELGHAGLGLVVLLAIQALNIYKPQGLTRYGRRKQEETA
jgi:hypothetical protein